MKPVVDDKSVGAYRFRVKSEAIPRELWRDILIGRDRTLVDFQRTVNESMGLDQDHLWYFGTNQDYWDSKVMYQSPLEFEELKTGHPMRPDYSTVHAGKVSMSRLVQQLDLEIGDRFCYLFDYGDEWRFYAILKEVYRDKSRGLEPEVVKEIGDPVKQYWFER